MLVQILAVCRRVITLPVIGPKPENFGSASEVVTDFGDRNGIEIGMRCGRRRLEGMEVAAFFDGEAAFFIKGCPEPVQS